MKQGLGLHGGQAAPRDPALWGLVSPPWALAEPGHPRLLMECTPHGSPARQTGSRDDLRSYRCAGHWPAGVSTDRLPRNHSGWKILGASQGPIHIL